jgi:hypothetical protein
MILLEGVAAGITRDYQISDLNFLKCIGQIKGRIAIGADRDGRRWGTGRTPATVITRLAEDKLTNRKLLVRPVDQLGGPGLPASLTITCAARACSATAQRMTRRARSTRLSLHPHRTIRWIASACSPLGDDGLLHRVIFRETTCRANRPILRKRFPGAALIVSIIREDRRMPITRPLAEAIRRRIAQVASNLSGHAADYFLDLIGPVEPVTHGAMDGEGSWRLASYFGTQQDAVTIEHAITIVHREHPLMRAPSAKHTVA